MKQLNERHTWFNLDKNDESYVLRYTTKDGSMLDQKYIERLENNTNEVVIHRYGIIVFKEILMSIEDYAFHYCIDLTSITIPNSVKRIGENAFYDCRCLNSIDIPNSVTSIGDGAFHCCYGLTSVAIPNSVTSIGGSAFLECTGLSTVTVQNSETSIGYKAFYNCDALTDITYNGTSTEFKKIILGNNVFNTSVEIHCTD